MSLPVSSAIQPVLIHDDDVATHLYHIAQEAVNNAIKHGHGATSPSLWVPAENGGALLSISDDGMGSAKTAANSPGHGIAHHELPGQDDRRHAWRFILPNRVARW